MSMRRDLSLSPASIAETSPDPLDWRLLDEFQHDFPLTSRPYTEIARQLEITEYEVLNRLAKLHEQGCISRIGPVFRPHSIGTSCLAAMAVAEEQLASVADYVSAQPEVNHNYQREHRLNLWFVITGYNQSCIDSVVARIESATGHSIMVLPMLASYHIDLGFSLR